MIARLFGLRFTSNKHHSLCSTAEMKWSRAGSLFIEKEFFTRNSQLVFMLLLVYLIFPQIIFIHHSINARVSFDERECRRKYPEQDTGRSRSFIYLFVPTWDVTASYCELPERSGFYLSIFEHTRGLPHFHWIFGIEKVHIIPFEPGPGS